MLSKYTKYGTYIDAFIVTSDAACRDERGPGDSFFPSPLLGFVFNPYFQVLKRFAVDIHYNKDLTGLKWPMPV